MFCLHQQNGGVLLLVDFAHDSEDLPDQQGRKAQRGLVQEQQIGMGHQGTADNHHLKLTAAAESGQGFFTPGQGRKQVVNPFQVLMIGPAPTGGGADLEIFFDGQVFES